MRITVKFATGTPTTKVFDNSTLLRTVASDTTFRLETSARQISSIDVDPANSGERFTLEIRPGAGSPRRVTAAVIEGTAVPTAFTEGSGAAATQGVSVLCATSSVDNLVELEVATPSTLESVVSRSPDAPDAPDEEPGGGPALIFVKVRVRRPV